MVYRNTISHAGLVGGGNVRFMGRQRDTMVLGVGPAFSDMRNMHVERGTFIREEDLNSRRRVVVLGAASAFVDFDTFFAAFHGLFFRSGTWTFPYDSMLIRLFPERFWIASGVAWATLTGAGAAVLLVAAKVLPSGPAQATPVTKHEEGASRTADNV